MEVEVAQYFEILNNTELYTLGFYVMGFSSRLKTKGWEEGTFRIPSS